MYTYESGLKELILYPLINSSKLPVYYDMSLNQVFICNDNRGVI